ncbi:MAG: arginine--tRNA ligase [Clostridiales bacterium]|nr:arginine--tRNA ligase [Clostridiales bacterium]
MDMMTRIATLTAQTLANAWPEAAGLPDAGEIRGLLAVPPDPAMGDYAFPVFRLAKVLRMGPPVIAQKLAAAWQHGDVARVEAVNGYMNFFLNRNNFARETLQAVLSAGESYGSSDMGKGKKICLDYSSINIAKRFHIGHLSTTMLGHSLKRIYDHLGYTTVGINHLGDWGTQFGKMVAAYKLWGNKEEVEKGGVDAMVALYVRFDQEAQKDESLNDLGRAWFKKIEDGDEEALSIFNWFKSVTLKDAERVYDMLGVKFDSYAGESFYNDKMDRVVEELRAKNLLVESQGAQVVDLEAYNMPPCIILRSDGATLYATRDLAAALYRKDTYDFEKCLYVVAYQQDLHFRQIFKVLELMGYDWAANMKHVAFGMVSYEGQALSTRKGHVVYLDDLLRQAQEKALAIINEKSPNLENKEDVARQVGIGAVVYTDLSNGRIKDIDFCWDRALNFDGETGPYVQYTHARCCSVLRKAADVNLPEMDIAALEDDEAQHLLRLISRFPDVVKEAGEKYEPSMITRAVTDIAQGYNKFYYEHRILDENPAYAAARVALTQAVKNVIKIGLFLIGIEAPERM